MANTLQAANVANTQFTWRKTQGDLYKFGVALSWNEIIARRLVYKALDIDTIKGFYTSDERIFLLSIL